MKVLSTIFLGLIFAMSTAFLSDINSFEDLSCFAASGTVCVDERQDCEEEDLWTFSCGSDICDNRSEQQCYICVGSEGDG